MIHSIEPRDLEYYEFNSLKEAKIEAVKYAVMLNHHIQISSRPDEKPHLVTWRSVAPDGTIVKSKTFNFLTSNF
jgi:hypothetical protein